MTQLSFSISVVPFSSEKNLPQTEQVQYALLPSSVQVGSFASVLVRLCVVEVFTTEALSDSGPKVSPAAFSA